MHDNAPSPSERTPAPAVCTGRTLALVVPYDSTGETRVAGEQPTQTLTTRDRAAVVFTEDEIDDCLFRMFQLHEIAGAMVMAEHVDGGDYIVTGNKRERMAQYGNAVTPPAARELILRVLEVL
jgi:DNA (cytosine-5)-methyltransferase 1